jgi:formylmethanofuran dehydrogenase subunit E
MHGLYCSNESCYTRLADGNLAPPASCEKCSENTFYYEKDGTVESGTYLCIACSHEEAIQ